MQQRNRALGAMSQREYELVRGRMNALNQPGLGMMSDREAMMMQHNPALGQMSERERQILLRRQAEAAFYRNREEALRNPQNAPNRTIDLNQILSWHPRYLLQYVTDRINRATGN